jgi:hypothetical protein
MKKVQAERDGNNAGSEDKAPPVIPADVGKLRPAIFVEDVLQPYREHIGRFWSDEAIYEIEHQHRSLRDAYSKEDACKKIIDMHTFKTSFNDGWDSISVRFERQRQLSGGLRQYSPIRPWWNRIFPSLNGRRTSFDRRRWTYPWRGYSRASNTRF